jgi:hypothetical protein
VSYLAGAYAFALVVLGGYVYSLIRRHSAAAAALRELEP